MLMELQGLELLLSQWNRHPDAPASMISPFSADAARDSAFSEIEVVRMKEYLAHHAPSSFRRLFPEEDFPTERDATPSD